MKKQISLLLTLALLTMALSGCGQTEKETPGATDLVSSEKAWEDAVRIELSDGTITVDGQIVSTDASAAVYVANDIVYYEEGKDFTYGEGTESDAHSQEEAKSHTVVHITQPGCYVLSGKLSAGQVAVDLGEDAEKDPAAVVTLILDGVDITSTVAPAVIFYNVYECGSTDAETVSETVDTSAAGANVIIADGTTNTVNGSYVARIYKPDSVQLNADGTEVEDAKKLHKYDAAFYSKMSMNVDGEAEDTGILRINAENEGLDSELHLTINGGTIDIHSGNDGINTNEDGVSVTTINGGTVSIAVTGETGEGDGIDSNGWLVINGGRVIAAACSDSADAGIDSEMGIHINGGIVMATGHMLDRIEEGGQNYAVFNFAERQSGDEVISLKNTAAEELMALRPVNDYTCLIYSSPELTGGEEYTLWQGDTQLSSMSGDGMGMMGGRGSFRPDGQPMPEKEDFDPAELREKPEGGNRGERPEGMELPDGMEHPENGQRPESDNDASTQMPRLEGQGGHPGGQQAVGETSDTFTVTDGGNYFTVVSE